MDPERYAEDEDVASGERQSEEWRPDTAGKPSRVKTQRSSIGVFLLGAIFFVGFPALFTAIAPVSYVHLERQGDDVCASSKTCLLFFVPYSRQHVEQVIGVNDRFRAGGVSRPRGGGKSTKAEDEAFLVLHGEREGDFLEVSVSPVNIKSRVELVEHFLKDDRSSELRLVCVSNWKFAVFAGGMVSLLTVLWAIGTIWSIVRWCLRLVLP